MSAEYFTSWGASVPLTGWVLHSPYSGPRWRGVEKCFAVNGEALAHVFESPQAARKFSEEHDLVGFRVVQVTLSTPEVGAVLHGNDQDMSRFAVKHNKKLEGRPPDFVAAVETIAQAAASDCLERVVEPACRKYGVKFMAGNGTWFFTYKDDILDEGVWPCKDWEEQPDGSEVARDFPEGWGETYREVEEAVEQELLGHPLFYYM